jgi:hypothetical protein
MRAQYSEMAENGFPCLKSSRWQQYTVQSNLSFMRHMWWAKMSSSSINYIGEKQQAASPYTVQPIAS